MIELPFHLRKDERHAEAQVVPAAECNELIPAGYKRPAVFMDVGIADLRATDDEARFDGLDEQPYIAIARVDHGAVHGCREERLRRVLVHRQFGFFQTGSHFAQTGFSCESPKRVHLSGAGEGALEGGHPIGGRSRLSATTSPGYATSQSYRIECQAVIWLIYAD